MSGFSQVRRQQQLIELLQGHGLADSYKVVNDSVGSAFTMSDKGAVVHRAQRAPRCSPC